MPGLLASLLPHDLGHLRILAELWGLELDAHERDAAADELSASLLDLDLVRETLDVLPANARLALDALLAARGRVPWAEFARRFGEIREMGAGKRDREHPHRHPVSAAEMLFYRGILARAFFDTEKGAREFAYIPDDLLSVINREAREGREENAGEVLGRPATPVEKTFEIPANDHILDDATTLLAALRVGRAEWHSAPQLPALLHTSKILKKNIPQAEAVKKFLEAPRFEALSLLAEAWKSSTTFDELRLIPSILCEGEWKNDPRETRQTLLNFLNATPPNQWWSFPAFIRDLKLKHPDFQRPAGDYDSWFIKRASDGQYLRGFAYWDSVDGALARFIIQTMHWLGLVDLAAPEEGKEFTAFRLVEKSTQIDRYTSKQGKITIASNGKISVERFASRAIRYQIARFCDWDEEKRDEYQYHVSARSLKRATEQGLKAEQLLALLVKVTKGNVPPALVKALKRWEANGTEARAESQTILRVTRPDVLEELRKSKAARFLGEPLGTTAVIVKSEAVPKIAAALAELGVLLDVIEPPAL
ncbi:MAG: hypothetical protein C4583_01000 [Anaerolineaceae bacterium]|nr:MAG: hypothetical protein C4583_01000 [Anaerolineaceae bacterium]